jgi:hypothetical protein
MERMMRAIPGLRKQENVQKHFCFYELNSSFIPIKNVENSINLRQLYMDASKCLHGNPPQTGD